jgi:hypothetical protein
MRYAVDGKKLIELRGRTFLSRNELARRSDLETSAIQRIGQTGATTIRAKTLRGLAKGFQMEEGMLLEQIKLNGDHLEAGIEPVEQLAPIPEWTVEICASAWIEVPLCQLDYDDPEQRRVIESGRFRLRIIGNCMEPDYQDGQVIEFQIVRWDHVTPLEIGVDYVVCRSDGMATFKRLVKVDDDTLSLAALNQQQYPGLLVVNKQDVVRLARVAFRLVGPPPASVPKIKMPARIK